MCAREKEKGERGERQREGETVYVRERGREREGETVYVRARRRERERERQREKEGERAREGGDCLRERERRRD